MSKTSNKRLARQLLEEVVNQRALERLPDLIAPDCAHRDLALAGPEGYRQHLETFLQCYPDLHVTVDGQVAEEDIVVTWFTAVGTHEGSWKGLPPTHRRLRLKGVNIQRIRDGRIVEQWGGSNSLEALMELGLVQWARPDPEQPEPHRAVS